MPNIVKITNQKAIGYLNGKTQWSETGIDDKGQVWHWQSESWSTMTADGLYEQHCGAPFNFHRASSALGLHGG